MLMNDTTKMPGNKNSGRKKKLSTDSVISPPSKRPRGRPSKAKEDDGGKLKSQKSVQHDQLRYTPEYHEYPRKDPLQIRNSATNREWDQAIGSALQMIPKTKFPTIRVILKRYRYLRTKDS